MRWSLPGVLLLSSLATGAYAQSATTLCTTLEGGGAEQAGLQRLLESEVARHPSHRAVVAECESVLRVELIRVGKRSYLNAQLGEQVPHRKEVERDDYAAALEELLTIVLHNDPHRLRGPSDAGVVGESFGKLRQHGHNVYAVELLEALGLAQGARNFVPALAFHLRREIGVVQLGARLLAGGLPSASSSEAALRGFGALHLTGALFTSPRASSSAYAGLLLGVQHAWFEAQASPSTESATGLDFGVRGGVEWLRETTLRAELFCELRTTVFVADPEDLEHIPNLLPLLALGVSVGF
jgi:hypothetical protein